MLWSSEEILKPDDREEGEKKVNLYINYLFFFFFFSKENNGTQKCGNNNNKKLVNKTFLV